MSEYNLVLDSLEKVRHKILKFNKENQNILGDITNEIECELKLDPNLIGSMFNSSKRFFEHKKKTTSDLFLQKKKELLDSLDSLSKSFF